MLCTFVPGEPNFQVCTVCDQEPVRAAHGVRVRRNCRQAAALTKPDPAKQLCIHLGESTGFRECPSCKGTVKQKTFRCLKGHGENSQVTLIECRTCRDYQAAKLTRVPLPDYCFNAAIFEQEGRLRLCWRQKPAGSNILVGDLAGDYSVENAIKLDLVHPLCRSGREDPRVFWWQGRLHVGFCGVEMRASRIFAHQLLTRLDEAGKAVLLAWEPIYPARAPWEKNWGWFEHEEKLHCVYSISPHVVLQQDDILFMRKVAETQWSPKWSGGHLRGGASPVRVGDEYWSFFHGTLDQPGSPRRVYSLGLYCFEAQPPFRPTRYTPEPLLWPDEKTRPQNLGVSVVFPCGAVLREGKWLASMGVHDRWIEIAEFSHASLERMLVKA